LGRGPGRAAFVRAVVASVAAPVVLDADGLVALAGDAAAVAGLAACRALVLTPHAGEFRALFPERASRLGVDPWAEAAETAALTRAVMLLKGVPTVIGAPGRPPVTVAAGNPGLATGGSGDTLSGLVAAWLARGVEPQLAAALGAQALGEAGDLAARRVTARALRPADVTAALPDVWRHWAAAARGPARVEAPVLCELPAPARV
jgi:ADP-dependent NAD(P)H-hydrate dehydratase / NAD(P)H-hydrate epimerase